MDGTPNLVLIRPKEQSLRLLRECEALTGTKISTVLAPVIKIVPVNADPDISRYQGLIITSENGVHNAGQLQGIRLYCVGSRTKHAAERAGANVLWMAKTSTELKARLRQETPAGPLLHLRGKHVVEDMVIPGIETDSVVVYDQIPVPISAQLRKAVCGDMPGVLPLYSPRSAVLLGRGIEEVGPNLHVIAISDAVAHVWQKETGGTCEVSDAPVAAEMVNKIVTALQK